MITAVKEMAEAKTKAIDSTISLENLQELFPLFPILMTLLPVVDAGRTIRLGTDAALIAPGIDEYVNRS